MHHFLPKKLLIFDFRGRHFLAHAYMIKLTLEHDRGRQIYINVYLYGWGASHLPEKVGSLNMIKSIYFTPSFGYIPYK